MVGGRAQALDRQAADQRVLKLHRHLLVHRRRVGGAGGDGVDADVALAQLVGQRRGEEVEARLGQAVEAADAHPRCGGGLVDDRPAPSFVRTLRLAHRTHDRSGAVQRTHQVYRHERVEVVVVDVGQAGQLHVAEDGGVVDQVVDASEGLEGRLGHGVGAGRVAHVGLHEQRTLAERVGHRLTGGLVELGDDHVGALGVQGPGVGLADAAPCAGDDGCAVGESLSFGHVGVLQGWGSEHPA